MDRQITELEKLLRCRDDAPATRPAASILIPSSGRPEVLELTLDALCRQCVPSAEFEVIVVDDGARPPLTERLRPYAGRLVLRSIRLEGQGPGAARNAGARLAASPLLVFLDDDCVPHPDWLKAYLSAWVESPDCILAGPIVNGLPDDKYAEAYHLVFGYLYSRHLSESSAPDSASSSPFVISANFAVAGDLFRTLGGFDEGFRVASEDRMFSEEWLRSGRTFRAVPDAIVLHHRPFTLSRYVAQQYRYGRGGMIFRKALRQRGWTGKRFEQKSFYWQLLLSTFQHPKPRFRVPLFLLVALSQAAIAAGYAAEYARTSILPHRNVAA